MDGNAKRIYSIEVEKGTRQVLDLLTRKRCFTMLTVRGRITAEQERELERELGAGEAWCKVHATGTADGQRPNEEAFLAARALEGDARSRDRARRAAGGSERRTWHLLRVCGGAVEVSLAQPTIGELYELAGDGRLECRIAASGEAEANRIWLRDMLRLGRDPGKWYASDDYTSVKVTMRPISGAAGSDAPAGAPHPVDIAEYEVYDRLRGSLARAAWIGDCGYGDDVFVEYSMSSDEGYARYCATEFYSNHEWDADPANLLVARFCAEVSQGGCGKEEVSRSHPAKATYRKADRERFLVDGMAMENDVEVKFMTGWGEQDRRPDEIVSADRRMGSPVDFEKWVRMHRTEIGLI